MVSNASEIELSEPKIAMRFVNEAGKLKKACRSEFLEKTEIHGSVELWDTFKGALNTKQKKGIAGEVAAKFFFESIGYKILEDHYDEHIALMKRKVANSNMKTDKTCTTKKGPDNGIDGIFILEDENFGDPSHIVINEAKFRSGALSERDFGFVAGNIQQAHSEWNRDRIPACFSLDYDDCIVVRTATVLDKKGVLRLHEVRDKEAAGTIVGEYASEAHRGWNLRKIYDSTPLSRVEGKFVELR